MANILYGVCGEGYGHSSRVDQVTKWLEELDHTVDIATFGDGLDYFEGRENLIEIQGLRYGLNQDGSINKFKTLYNFTTNWLFNNSNHKKYTNRRYDLILSDFEPSVCWYARKKKIPLVIMWKKTLKKQESTWLALLD